MDDVHEALCSDDNVFPATIHDAGFCSEAQPRVPDCAAAGNPRAVPHQDCPLHQTCYLETSWYSLINTDDDITAILSWVLIVRSQDSIPLTHTKHERVESQRCPDGLVVKEEWEFSILDIPECLFLIRDYDIIIRPLHWPLIRLVTAL